MRRDVAAGLAALALVLALLGAVAYGFGFVELPGEDDHERAVVTLLDENGTRLATVQADVADSRRERIRGLSGTDALENGSGMLFVHPREGERTYVMRDMAFPLDIVFVAACDADCPDGVDGRVTTVHAAPVPPEDADELTPYEGRGKWVLEVPRGYADANDVATGDYVRIRYVA